MTSHSPESTPQLAIQDSMLWQITQEIRDIKIDLKPLPGIGEKLDHIEKRLEEGAEKFGSQETRIRALENHKSSSIQKIKRCDRLEKKMKKLENETTRNSTFRKLVYGALTIGGSGAGLGLYHLISSR